jgi:hypothetical protein
LSRACVTRSPARRRIRSALFLSNAPPRICDASLARSAKCSKAGPGAWRPVAPHGHAARLSVWSYGRPSFNSAFASCRSAVSKSSVNQP